MWLPLHHQAMVVIETAAAVRVAVGTAVRPWRCKGHGGEGGSERVIGCGEGLAQCVLETSLRHILKAN